MATSFRHEGNRRKITLTEAVVSGQVVSMGASGRVGVAIASGDIGQEVAFAVSGVWAFPNPDNVVLAQGDDALLDLASGAIAAAGTSIGEVDEILPDGRVGVLLNGLPGSTATR